MHSFSISNVTFHYNGDFSGPIAVSKKQTGREMGVPFEALKNAVAFWAAALLKERLRKATPEEVIQNNLPVIQGFSLKAVFVLEVEASPIDGGKCTVQYFPEGSTVEAYLLLSNAAGQSITVDFEAVKAFVSLYVARNLESRLCDLTPDQLFQFTPPTK